MSIKIISAGAGSGKTYRLTSEMVALLEKGEVQASGIIATTFTRKAAAELQERVRVRLLESGMTQAADELTNALIGTVHGLGVKLLRRFAFEAGVSPEVAIIADEDQQVMFNQSLATVVTNDKVETMEHLCQKLGLHKKERYDWRLIVKNLTEVARANDFGKDVLEKSKKLSFESFQELFDVKISTATEHFGGEKAINLLTNTIEILQNGEDATKVTQTAIRDLRNLLNELNLRGELFWHQWVKISKLKTGAKSRDNVADLKEFAQKHDRHPAFHEDIKNFIFNIFDIALEALDEYDAYKKRRGLIDYTDMEVLIKELLKNESVQEVLKEELDLLMVDEFQDTSPIQLEIFLKLSQFAKNSVWVGDPKQSIYGFRGAEPKLMHAIIEKNGGVKKENVQIHSWRSREDIVFATNALFTKAFPELPKEQIALIPKRQKIAIPDETMNKENEPPEMSEALVHWHFQPDIDGKRIPGKPWMENCIANSIKTMLDRGTVVFPKEEKIYRPVRPGDVAVLCRSNRACLEMAEALHRAGLRAAISRAGLLGTAESKLILACLKFVLNKRDSLSLAEILLLAANLSIEEIIEDRLDFLQKLEANKETDTKLDFKWGEQNAFIQQLNELRTQVIELSSAEILNLLLEELDLRRIIVSWGNVEQRLANVDVLRKFALQYEEACNRLHTAASLGGFLLWLNDLENNEKDLQGSGESADAVNVLTYHKSKGLEWPVVICHSLEQKMRADVWGISLMSESEEVDLDNLLGNRWLRYWINPYSDQIRGTRLAEKIETSEAKKQKTKEALEEEARLLYVGITRARDYLVFPTRPKPTNWLNRVWHNGKEDFPTLDPHNFESPWEWNDKMLPLNLEIELYPKDFPHAELPQENIEYLQPAIGKSAHKPYILELNNGTHFSYKCTTSRPNNYVPPLPITDDAEPYVLAKVTKAFFTADNQNYSRQTRLAMAEAFLKRYEVEETLDAKALIRASDAYFDWLKNTFDYTQIHKKYPIRLHRNGQLFSKIIDVILETKNGLVIIQNSGFAGADKKLAPHAKKNLGDWFYLNKKAVQSHFDNPTVRTYVHFVMRGVVLEMKIKEEQLALF